MNKFSFILDNDLIKEQNLSIHEFLILLSLENFIEYNYTILKIMST